jgi:hypothetical protein
MASPRLTSTKRGAREVGDPITGKPDDMTWAPVSWDLAKGGVRVKCPARGK